MGNLGNADYPYDEYSSTSDYSDPVYWRILITRDHKISVAGMQSFDEDDYNQNSFLRGEDRRPIRFDSEEEAVLYLNEHYKPEFIDDEYLTPNNQAFFRSVEHD